MWSNISLYGTSPRCIPFPMYMNTALSVVGGLLLSGDVLKNRLVANAITTIPSATSAFLSRASCCILSVNGAKRNGRKIIHPIHAAITKTPVDITRIRAIHFSGLLISPPFNFSPSASIVFCTSGTFSRITAQTNAYANTAASIFSFLFSILISPHKLRANGRARMRELAFLTVPRAKMHLDENTRMYFHQASFLTKITSLLAT